jgi:ankyrin repeat protein
MMAHTSPRLRSGIAGALCLVVLAASSPEAPVADAAEDGDRATVEALLARGMDVNAAQGDGMTALHWAAYRADAELTRVVLDADPILDARTRLGSYTPLHLATRSGNDEVVELLVDAGADVTARTSTGDVQPLHFAAAGGSARAVSLLVEHGADPDAIESTWGQTPLMFAASYGRTGAVRALVSHGADVSVTSKVVDIARKAILDRMDRERRNARMRGEPDPYPDGLPKSAEEIISEEEEATRQIEDPEPLSYAELVGHQGGNTALIHAVREGFTETALALLEAGADINQVSAGTRTSPLLSAMINGHFDLGLTLLERGADPNLVDEAGTGPVFAALNAHWAPKSRYPQQNAYKQQDASYLDVVGTLLEAGADPNALLEKHLWYMGYNFDLLQIDTKGATPFWRAAYALDIPAMSLLVEHGADPNIPTANVPERRRRGAGPEDGLDPSGLPPVPVGGPAVFPIHAASGVGYGLGFAANAHRHVPGAWVEAVRYLVEELGADVNQRDHNGYTALHHAAARGDNDLIRYLVSQGADVTVVSRRGQTTADMANGPVQRTQPFPETVALLESLGSVNNHNCVSC